MATWNHNSRYFNPRSPCGERLLPDLASGPSIEFQSTLPMRGATPPKEGSLTTRGISIHAPHAGSDQDQDRRACHAQDFNPRSPCGERRALTYTRHRSAYFNPRSPCGERRACTGRTRRGSYFNPCSPCGERLDCALSSFHT